MSNIDWTQFPAFMLACFWRFIVRSSKGIFQTLRWCMETDKGTRVGPLRSDDNMWDWFTIGAQTRGDWRGKSGLWVHARRKAVWHADTHAGWHHKHGLVSSPTGPDQCSSVFTGGCFCLQHQFFTRCLPSAYGNFLSLLMVVVLCDVVSVWSDGWIQMRREELDAFWKSSESY